jgi:hypothetical protein
MIISSDLETDRERLQDVCLLPASFAQQRLWFLNQLEPQNAAYNMAASLRLNFALDVEALHACFHLLLERHEVLRTTFAVVDGQPMQKIVAHADISMPLVDLTGYTEVEREREAIRMANEQANQPFDLAQGPLLRCTLLKLEQEAYMLLLAVHHIIFDEWSMQILFQELAALYQTFTTGKPSPLPELPLQYADFAVWQQEMYAQGMLADDLAYWKKQLADLPETIDLPLDYARGDMTSSLGAAQTVKLPHTLVAELKRLSQEQGVTLYMTFVAAFQTLLYRYSNQEDLALGTVSAGRTLAETEPLIGFFANTLVLRADLTGEPTFRQLLARVRESVLEAQAHQDVPFDMLVKALRLERSAGQKQWGRKVIHVFDRGYASAFWIGLLLSFQLRFVLRFTGKNHLLDAAGNERNCWRIPFGKKGWEEGIVWDSRRAMKVHASVLALPVRHPKHPDAPLWLVVCRSKGREPWYLLTDEAVNSPQDAWRIVFCYSRRWQIEQTWRYDKSELAFQSPRVWNWQVRLKLLALATLAYAFLFHLLAPRYGPLRLWLLRHYCHRTGQHLRRVKAPLYRLRNALSRLWQQHPPNWWALAQPPAPPARPIIGVAVVVQEG